MLEYEAGAIMKEKKEKFDKRKYDIEYMKTHKTQFNVRLNNDVYQELELLLKKHNLTKVQFIKNGIEELKKK